MCVAFFLTAEIHDFGLIAALFVKNKQFLDLEQKNVENQRCRA